MITKALRPGLVILVVLLSFLALGPAVGSRPSFRPATVGQTTDLEVPWPLVVTQP